MRRARTLVVGSSEQVHFCSVLFFVSIFFFYISFPNSQVSSASSPPPQAHTGEGVPLNAFSLASPALDIVGTAAVNNTAGPLWDMIAKRTALMRPVVAVLLGRGVPVAVGEAAVPAGTGPVPCA